MSVEGSKGHEVNSLRQSASQHSALHSPIGRVVATAVQQSTGRVPRDGFRRLGAHAFVFLLAGHGRYQDEHGTDTVVSAGDMIMIFPTIDHAYGPEPGSSWVERYVVYEGPVFALWYDTGVLDTQKPVVQLGNANEWNRRIDNLFADSGRIGALSALEEVCRLQLFLAQVHDANTVSGLMSVEDRDWLSAARALLGSSASGRDDALALPSIAERFSLSYDGFRKRFRRLAGISPGRYRSLQQIERARAMILAGTMTDREISETLGFHDASHFSRRFKEIMGRSPREFRAALPVSRR